MEIQEYFKSPPEPLSGRKLIDLVCDNVDCGIVFKQAPSEAKRHKLHFHSRKCHGAWLFKERMRLRKINEISKAASAGLAESSESLIPQPDECPLGDKCP